MNTNQEKNQPDGNKDDTDQKLQYRFKRQPDQGILKDKTNMVMGRIA